VYATTNIPDHVMIGVYLSPCRWSTTRPAAMADDVPTRALASEKAADGDADRGHEKRN
jgi:hypothetical protein